MHGYMYMLTCTHELCTHVDPTRLKERPNYTDCHLRLGAIAEARGNNKEASVWYRQALTVSPHCADAYTALATLLAASGDLAGAQKKLEKILQRNDKDGYASIMLGNIYFNNAKYDRHRESKEKDLESRKKYEMLLSRALDRYAHVLHKQHSNVFAANGAAAVLFQTGRVREAKHMFLQVGREGEGVKEAMRMSWLVPVSAHTRVSA